MIACVRSKVAPPMCPHIHSRRLLLFLRSWPWPCDRPLPFSSFSIVFVRPGRTCERGRLTPKHLKCRARSTGNAFVWPLAMVATPRQWLVEYVPNVASRARSRPRSRIGPRPNRGRVPSALAIAHDQPHVGALEAALPLKHSHRHRRLIGESERRPAAAKRKAAGRPSA
eukprot:scaffold105543_cov30-Tisochrysis_lutea.AAC.3